MLRKRGAHVVKKPPRIAMPSDWTGERRLRITLFLCFRAFSFRSDFRLAAHCETINAMMILLMGVTGSGKTTIGRALSAALGWKYFDADDFHSAANVEKMRSGIALDDRDRQPWLERLRALIQENLDANESAILACSALRERYRELLLIDDRVQLVYLKGDFEVIENRLRARSNHYMNPQLLDSQFQTLEEPADRGLHVDIRSSPSEIVSTIRKGLGI